MGPKRHHDPRCAPFLRLLADGSLSAADASEMAAELLEGEGGPQKNVEHKLPDKKVNRVNSQKGRTRTELFVDGLGAGNGSDVRALLWQPFVSPNDGASPPPSTKQGAEAWMKRQANVGFKVSAYRNNCQLLIWRCVTHPPTLVDGVLRACGCLWRADKASGWCIRVRAPDWRWSGQHIMCTESETAAALTKGRSNSKFYLDTVKYIETEAAKGRKPKQIFSDLCDKVLETMTVEDKKTFSTKEGKLERLGFQLYDVQRKVERLRLTYGNGFYVQSLSDLQVLGKSIC